MGDNATAHLELQHRDLLKKAAAKAGKSLDLSPFQIHILADALMTVFNEGKVWIIPATKDAAREAGAL
jgi:hypothetical protein